MKSLRIMILIVSAMLLFACSTNKKVETKEVEEPMKSKWTTNTGLEIEVLQEGDGAVAKAGDYVNVHYTGWLLDGTKFDSSVDRGQPFSFVLGRRKVIKGWDEGVAGMKIGEKRMLTIPPELGYGAMGAGGGVIPPNATLKFEVELISIK